MTLDHDFLAIKPRLILDLLRLLRYFFNVLLWDSAPFIYICVYFSNYLKGKHVLPSTMGLIIILGEICFGNLFEEANLSH